MMAGILLAADAFVGIMKGTGMITAMAKVGVSYVPKALALHIPFALGLGSMPLSLLFDPDSYYVMRVIAEMAKMLGIAPITVAQASLMGQMAVGFPVSPLTPATFLIRVDRDRTGRTPKVFNFISVARFDNHDDYLCSYRGFSILECVPKIPFGGFRP